jgi:5'-nucleotidase
VKPCILVTNDDGFDAPGIAALVEAVHDMGVLLVIAPDRERSAASHALTLASPLRLDQQAEGRFRVNGTPTDCVHLAVTRLTGGRLPDLVLSGYNRGLNVGDDVTYSGTVGAAIEGTLLHIPSIAFSVKVDPDGQINFDAAREFSRKIVGEVLERGLTPGLFLNVNFPAQRPRGARITRQGGRRYRSVTTEHTDPRGKPYFWIDTADTTPHKESDSDHSAIEQGFISISPLKTNMTAETSLPELSSWGLENF